MIVVADASAVGAFLLVDEAGPFADFARSICRDNAISVPSIWPTEIASLVTSAYRRRRINEIERNEALLGAEILRATVSIEPDSSISMLAEQAMLTGLSVYDTSYALLARRLDASLLTADGPLRRAATALGLKVLFP